MSDQSIFEDTVVFVGNIPYSMQEAELGSLFSEAGFSFVHSVVVKDERLRSRGFGFVQFDNQDTANNAIDKFNGNLLNDRRLRLSMARSDSRYLVELNKLMDKK
jgi:RNA recognition motif-containing protein